MIAFVLFQAGAHQFDGFQPVKEFLRTFPMSTTPSLQVERDSSPSSVSLSSAGLERAKWPRGKLFLFFTFARFARFPRSLDHPEGLLAVYHENCQEP